MSLVKCGVLSAAIGLARLPRDAPEVAAPTRARTRFDAIGLALLTATIGTMIPVVVLGHYWGWFDSASFVPWGIGFFLAGSLFVAWGTLSARPIVDLRPLAVRNFGLGLVIKALFSIDLFALASLLSGYMMPMKIMHSKYPIIADIATSLPFYYMLGAPVELMTKHLSSEQLIELIAWQIAWAVISVLVALWAWGKGVRHFEAVGG